MSRPRQAVKPQLTYHFVPASHSLGMGLLKAAHDDLRGLLKRATYLLTDIWFEMIYSTAVLIERMR